MKEKVTIIGTLNMELILQGIKGLPRWGQQIHGKTCRLVPAGSGPRVAFPLATLGVGSYFIGKVGNDLYGKEILNVLSRYNLNITGIEKVKTIPTGLCVSLVRPDGERSFVSFLGSVGQTDEALINKYYDLIKRTDFLLITGYWNLPGLRKGIKKILRKAKGNGKHILFDPGWATQGWSKDNKREILAILPLINTFLPNKEEAMALSGKSSFENMTKFFCKVGTQEVIIKLGKEGSIGYSVKEGFWQKEALSVKVVDTTAAGEAFNAGIIYGLIRNWGLEKRMKFANTLAGLLVADSKGNYPSLKKVETKMGVEYA